LRPLIKRQTVINARREIKMPDREVRTIRDLIYYQYAKIIEKCLGPR
jgi:hypothetical protein